MQTVENIRNQLVNLYNSGEFVIDRTGMRVIEIIGAQFVANCAYIFGQPNHSYIQREINWYKSQSLNVNDIEGKVPPIWIKTADSDGIVNSNYGWCIWSPQNYNQYDNVINDLKCNPDSRRSQITYTRPSIWNDYNMGGKNDYICTNSTNHFIRNNKLIYIVYMRSNDSIFGYMNDLAWHEHVFGKMYEDLKLTYKDLIKSEYIIWNAASLQLYERHFNLIDG